MSQNKLLRQLMGKDWDLGKVLHRQSARNHFVQEQTRQITIIYAKSKLEVQVPVTWSVNKLKCMMAFHFNMLNFDKFEFQCDKYLILGKTLVANLSGQQLIVTQAECPKSFQSYYKQNMQKLVKKYKISTQTSLYPITNKAFSCPMLCDIPKERQKNIEQIPVDRIRRINQDQQGIPLLNFVRVIGMGLLFNLLFSFASYTQIGILVGVALVYFLMDNYVNQNQRRRRELERIQRQAQRIEQRQQRQAPAQRQNIVQNSQKNIDDHQSQNQVKQEVSPTELKAEPKAEKNMEAQEQGLHEIQQARQIRPIQAKVTFLFAFLFQVVYCYALSIFPNWTVETHLHANQEKMDRIMDKVKELDPQASQQIKNWKNQKKMQQQKPKNE